MKLLKRTFFIFLSAGALLTPGLSAAALSLGTPSQFNSEITNIFENLPLPLHELIKDAENINSDVNVEIGKYSKTAPIQGPINLTQLNNFNLTQWLQNILHTGPLSTIYPIFIKIVNLAGNLAIWIFGLAVDLIKQGLALLH